ncbi:MAG: Crp/Fnr family transcriptional regulator [Steroidobacteraceae bacterium]
MKNRLIEALPRQGREHLLARCERVELDFAEVLFEPGQRIRYVFFPAGGVISLIAPTVADANFQVGLVGDEGMLGLPLLLGIKEASLRALVQGSGAAWRMRATPFCRELEQSVPLRRLLNRYVHVRLRQLTQTALCTHFHGVDARLARWLLTTADRAHSDQFYITQEFISSMLCVRRAGVNRAAALLQERRLIRYSRGHLAILDRRGLQAVACACYVAARESYAKILG